MPRLSDAERDRQLAAILRGEEPSIDWAPRLRATQATMPMLLARRSEPRVALAIRHRLAHAVAFAGCSVHTPVAEQERYYAMIAPRITRDVRSRRPYTLAPHAGPRLPMAHSAVEHGVAWAQTVDLEQVAEAVAAGTLADLIRAQVYGLGTAKAPYAAALFGDPEAACIDTHGLVDVLGYSFREAERRRNRWRYDRSGDLYREDVRRAFGRSDVAMSQWVTFAEIVPAFARTGHDVYFRAIGL